MKLTEAGKKKTAGTVEKNTYSVPDGSDGEPIDLSDDNELSALIGDKRGSERHKVVQNYIFSLLGGKSYEMSDGKIAIVDNSDAKHIASKSGGRRSAEISKIEDIIRKAVFEGEDNNVEHKKFDHFSYYKTNLKYGEEHFPIYVNVGRAKNDGTYHIYALTHEIRDSVHRQAGVGRVDTTGALRNGISDTTISQPAEKVKSPAENKPVEQHSVKPAEKEIRRIAGELTDESDLRTFGDVYRFAVGLKNEDTENTVLPIIA